MAIWSLTKERVDKLLSQIGAVEVEIDTLIKLSKEDLWNRDLDDFINEWRTQLAAEASIRKTVASMGRRASSKLKISGKEPARKRKGQGGDPDDSDFGLKVAAKKAPVVKRVQPKKEGLLSHLSPLAKPVGKSKSAVPKTSTKTSKVALNASDDDSVPKKTTDDVWMNVDGASGSDVAVAPIFQKAKSAATAQKAASISKVKSEDEDEKADEEVFRPAISRKPRAAAKKIPTYNLDDSDSNGDDLLLDVGKMVKGIENTSANHPSTTRPLFSTSMSRPGSSAGLPKKPTSSRGQTMDLDGDDTDYSKLAPPPAVKRGTSVTARRNIISDDDMDEDGDDIFTSNKPPTPKATKARKAPAPKPTKPKPATAAAKKASQPLPQPKKVMALSPAAKAYAAKKAKNAAAALQNESEDEMEKIADEIIGDSEAGEIDHFNDEDDEDDDGVVIRRPARKAATKAVEKVKEAWGDGGSEDEDEESAMFDDEDEESD